MARSLLCATAGQPAGYLRYDGVACAPVRARLRLCTSRLAEHRLLRHEAGVDDRCRACGAAGETVQHVFLECAAFDAARSAARTALRAVALDLDVAAIAGVAPDSAADWQRAVLHDATATLTLAVRARMRL